MAISSIKDFHIKSEHDIGQLLSAWKHIKNSYKKELEEEEELLETEFLEYILKDLKKLLTNNWISKKTFIIVLNSLSSIVTRQVDLELWMLLDIFFVQYSDKLGSENKTPFIVFKSYL